MAEEKKRRIRLPRGPSVKNPGGVNPGNWPDYLDEKYSTLVKAEFRSYFIPPFEVPSVVVINVGLALGAWFFISPSVVIRYTSLIFLPVALAAWAFADVPSTNLLGVHAGSAVKYIDKRRLLSRMITVKNIALWLLITPGCVILSIALWPSQHNPLLSLAITIAVQSLPFAYLGLAAIMAPLLPFHPLPWRERLRRRDTWIRYGLAIGIAYFALTGPAAFLALGPALLIMQFVGKEPSHLFIASILVIPWALFIWRMGIRISTKIAMRRKDWLEEFLSDPSRG